MDDLHELVIKAMGPSGDPQASLELRQRLKADPEISVKVNEFIQANSSLEWTTTEVTTFESLETLSFSSFKATVALAFTLNSPLQRLRRGVFNRLSVPKQQKAGEVLARTTVRVLTKSTLLAGLSKLRDNNYDKLKLLVESLDEQVKSLEDRLIEQLQRIASPRRTYMPERFYDSQEVTNSSGGSEDSESALRTWAARRLILNMSINTEQSAIWKWQLACEQISSAGQTQPTNNNINSQNSSRSEASFRAFREALII
mmetsp:Transcript_32877/g.57442  ORF Transcript_32877/g.57442 Transcript_32877/m.57442 type:complete len:257 (+) Transcript_32877:2298-3068(+)